MTPDAFIEDPWKQSSIHCAYDCSFLHMRPAPEYASGEVILASTYRQVGFSCNSVSEGKTPANGREFQKKLDKGIRPGKDGIGTDIETEAWRRIITGALRSPKQPNQATKRFLQLSPVVPDAALYSQSARLSTNSWNPGALVARLVQFGESSDASARELWSQMFHALAVDEQDDIWARFLQREFEAWRPRALESCWGKPSELPKDHAASSWHRAAAMIPAKRFAIDLRQVLALKSHLTRRQWISMVEAMLRLGTASHVLWVCRSNIECFRLVRAILGGGSPPSREELGERFGVGEGFWRYGQLASGTITESATGFVKARAGINLFLHYLDGLYEDIDDCLANVDTIHALATWIGNNRDRIDSARFTRDYQTVIESDQRLIAGQKGISANVREFLRHSLGQRQTAEPGLGSYDQGYFLAKRGGYRSAPWVVSLGPVSVLALVHACTHNARGPQTVEDFCRHVGEYGLEVRAQEVPKSSLGQTLRNLGLVLDSPDAEGGMVIVNPFEHLARENA